MTKDKFIAGTMGFILPFLAGCGASRSINVTTIAAKLLGTVQSGSQPIVNSQIQLYALVSKNGTYSSAPLLLAPVVTDANGAFAIPADVVCPANSTWVYLSSTGGEPLRGSSADNSAIAMLAILGECGSLSGSISISLNEVTTVASAFALSPYLRSVKDTSYTDAQFQAFDAAVETALELANPETGTAPGTGIPAGEIAPTAKLNSLANLTASCINSTGGAVGDDSPCGQLFAEASGSTENSPTDTVQALVGIALNPTRNVDSLYQLCPPQTPFEPALNSQPSDWSLNFEGVVAAPVLFPTPGNYNTALDVTLLDATPSASIYYTLDGGAPSPASTLYTAAIPLPNSAVIRAIAVVGDQTSAAVGGPYQISVPVVPRLVIIAQPQQALVATPFPSSFVVAFEDQNGSVLATMTSVIKVQLGANPGQTELDGATTITPVNGIASFRDLSIAIGGHGYTLVVSSSGVTNISSTPFNVVMNVKTSQTDLIEASGLLQTGSKLENFAAIGRPVPSVVSTNVGDTLGIDNGFFLPW